MKESVGFWAYYLLFCCHNKRVTTANMQESVALHELNSTNGMRVSPERIEEFQTAFRGEVIRPGNGSYETARKIWNASIDKYPGVIARCSGPADVVAAVNFARENRLLVAVRGGGHNVAGRALCDGGIVIDLSLMKGIYVDAKTIVRECRGEQRSATWIARLTSLAWLFRQGLYLRRALLGSLLEAAWVGWSGNTV